MRKTATDTFSLSSNDQTEAELRISKEIQKTGTHEKIESIPVFLLGKPGRCFASIAG
jgi:hypothetical protein